MTKMTKQEPMDRSLAYQSFFGCDDGYEPIRNFGSGDTGSTLWRNGLGILVLATNADPVWDVAEAGRRCHACGSELFVAPDGFDFCPECGHLL